MFKIMQRGIETLRQPDRSPRCYEMTEHERLTRIELLNNINMKTIPSDDHHVYRDQYGA